MKRQRFTNFSFACTLFAATAGLAPVALAQDSSRTADQQKSNKSDLELAQQIRRSVFSDKVLSTAAHNVKIISRDGTVTLRGNVNSPEEKKAIEDKAIEVAGTGKVTSELTVTPDSSK